MTLIDKAEALLPCPFCGGKARKWQDPSHSAAWFIGCDDGDRDCFGSIHWAETETEAIAAWNRRAALAAIPARGVGVNAATVKDAVMGWVWAEDSDVSKRLGPKHTEALIARILAAIAPTDAAHVNEKPKSEHDAGNVLTDAALIARLREIQGQAGLFASAAADRIEQLVKSRDAYAEMERIATEALRKSEARVERLEAALVEHNDLLRSALAIAKREGVEGQIASTNWDAYYNRVAVVLKRHHQTANEARASLKGTDHE